MSKILYLATLLALGCVSKSIGQESGLYIKRDVFTKLISVSSNTNHGDDILTVNVFDKIGDKIPWGKALTVVSYRYLGLDNQNNLHLQRRQSGDNSPPDICNLIFALDNNRSAEITLIAENSQKVPLLIRLLVEANNNGVRTKYLGNLPSYLE